MRRVPRGRLVVPDPRLEHIYRSLGASTTHCEVVDYLGCRFSCPSTDEYNDSERHQNDVYDIVACASCIPDGPAGAPGTTTGTGRTVVAQRLRVIAAELAEIADQL